MHRTGSLALALGLALSVVVAAADAHPSTPDPAQDIAPVTLTIVRAGTGLGTVRSAPDAVDCGTQCVASFLPGRQITLTTTPTEDSVFVQWSGDADCADGVVTLIGDVRCVAEFRAVAVGRPVPFISSVSPLTVTPGSSGFVLTVNGSHFSSDSVVRWNGIDRISTSTTASRIEVQISAAEIAAPGTSTVTIATGPPGGGVSNQAVVQVATAAPSPAFLLLTHRTGAHLAAMTVIDLNSDGQSDIVAVNASTSSVSVLIGDANGTFHTNGDFATGANPSAVHVADVNRDGRYDVVTANATSGNISVLLGENNGAFGAASDFGAGSGAAALAAGDLNADGFVDLVVANTVANSVSVLLGNGDGTFKPNVDYGTGATPRGVIIADFDEDGRLDVVTADQGASSLSLFPGVGDGTLGSRVAVAAGNGPSDLAAGDFNGDGVLDVAVVNELSSNISILLGDGVGTFRETTISLGGVPRAIALGDVDADGRLDAVVSNSGSDAISVLVGDRSGGFAPPLDFMVGSPSLFIAPADFDHDGRLDFALSGPGADTLSVLAGRLPARPNRLPVVMNPGAQISFQGVAFALALTADDADGDPLTWTAQRLPPGVTLNPLTGILSGVPATVGAYSATIAASDGWDSVSVSFAWSIASPLPGAATPITPSSPIATATPSFSWTGVPMASYYALSITDAGANSIGLMWYTPAQAGCAGGFVPCTIAAPRALLPGLVSWKVITWNMFGYGPWSTAASFVVDLSDPTVPTPTPGGPSGATTRTPTHTWTAVSEASWYQLSIVDALNEPREYWYTPAVCVAIGCAATPPQVTTGQAKWRIRAWRSTGASAWSAFVLFDAADAIPGKVTLVGPVGSVTTSIPTFTWNAVSMASYYLVRVTDRDEVSTERWYRPNQVGCAAGTGVCTATPGLVIKSGAASWRVLTWNAAGYGPWSETSSLLIEIPDPTAAVPAMVSPTRTIASASVTYQWTAVAGARSYRLSIRNNGGDASSFWYTAANAGCDATAECHVVPAMMLTSGTVDWQVQAWTTRGFGAWTAPMALQVSITAPPPRDRPASAVRLIEYGWDVPTPQFVRDHIRDMEHRPFNGVVMHLPDDGGQVFRPETWNADALSSQLPILADIQWESFDSNFLAMYATSSMDWYSDDDWRAVLEHAAFMARAARAGHLKGLIFDPEPYGPSPWNYSEQPRVSTHTFREYAIVVRERGRTFMRALQEEYPGLDVLTFVSYSYFLRGNAAPGVDTLEAVLREHAWGLLPAFLDGMLEEAGSNTHIIDGQEQSYYSERPEDFARGDADVREGALPYVSAELQPAYKSHVETAQPLYLDWIFGYFKASGPTPGDGLSDAQRAQLAEHHAYYAMKNVDRYVWVYSEKMNWWTNQNLPPGAEDALRSAQRKFVGGEEAP